MAGDGQDRLEPSICGLYTDPKKRGHEPTPPPNQNPTSERLPCLVLSPGMRTKT